MRMTIEKIMKIRHGGHSIFSNGGIFFDGDKFFKTRTVLGHNIFGFEKGNKISADQWEEIEVIGMEQKGGNMQKSVNILESKDIKAITIDGKEQSVTSILVMKELYQRDGSKAWNESGKESRVIVLADETMLIRIPREENGEYIWAKGKMKSHASKYQAFFKGTPEQPGPARRFAASGETDRVNFILENIEWEMTDLGAVKISGNAFLAKDNDQLYYVTARSNDVVLFYLDARIGEAQGTGGLFMGQEINPETDIDEVL